MKYWGSFVISAVTKTTNIIWISVTFESNFDNYWRYVMAFILHHDIGSVRG